MVRLGALGLAVLLLSSSPALAGIGKGSGEIGFDFGATSWDQDVSSKSAARLSFRGGYHLTSLFEVEGEISSSAHYDIHLQGTKRADIVLTTIMLNGVLNFHSKSGQIVPYVLGGVGHANLDFPFADLSDSGTAWQVGGGCRFFFGESHRTAFRLQVSWLTEDTFDVSSRHTHYVAGFTWRLGGAS